MTISGGRGNDTIYNDSKWSTVYGGVGADSIISTNVASNMYLSGDSEGDTIKNYSANSTLEGGRGNDWIYNYAEGTTILYRNHDDEDNIYTYADDTVVLLPDISLDDITSTSKGDGYYEIHFNKTNSIFIQNTGHNLNFVLSDGKRYTYNGAKGDFA